MIGLKGTLNCIDNTGALLVECVNVLKHKVNNGHASVGDEIVCVIKQSRPITSASLAAATVQKVKRGDVRRAVVVRTKRPMMRPDGRFVRFDDNAVVLLNQKKELLGTRITGVVSADLRARGWSKIASLAPRFWHDFSIRRFKAIVSTPLSPRDMLQLYHTSRQLGFVPAVQHSFSRNINGRAMVQPLLACDYHHHTLHGVTAAEVVYPAYGYHLVSNWRHGEFAKLSYQR